MGNITTLPSTSCLRVVKASPTNCSWFRSRACNRFTCMHNLTSGLPQTLQAQCFGITCQQKPQTGQFAVTSGQLTGHQKCAQCRQKAPTWSKLVILSWMMGPLWSSISKGTPRAVRGVRMSLHRRLSQSA